MRDPAVHDGPIQPFTFSEIRNGELLQWGQTQYRYDEHGRLVTKTLADGAQWAYRWSPAGRLLEVARPDGEVVRFAYDALGRRTQKSFAGEVTSYVWDGNDLVHQQKRRADGSLAPLSTWVFEADTFAPIAKMEGHRRYGVINDHLGVPQLLTNEKGDVAWQAQLDIYGVPRDETRGGGAGGGGRGPAGGARRWGRGDDDDGEAPPVEQPLRFPGQFHDPETGSSTTDTATTTPKPAATSAKTPLASPGGSRSTATLLTRLPNLTLLGSRSARDEKSTQCASK